MVVITPRTVSHCFLLHSILFKTTTTTTTTTTIFISPSIFSMSSGFLTATTPVAGSGYIGLKPDPSAKLFQVKSLVGWQARTISNGSRVHCMKTWSPINNKKFEALSYLPPLSDESIAKEVDYMLAKGWVPCLEFDEEGHVHRTHSQIPGYYDGRYWTLWKLPMFGCVDSSQVLDEIEECKKAYPNAYIRLLSFDSKHQCQCMSIVIQKPAAATTNASTDA